MYLRRENEILQYFRFLLFKEQKGKIIKRNYIFRMKKIKFLYHSVLFCLSRHIESFATVSNDVMV